MAPPLLRLGCMPTISNQRGVAAVAFASLWCLIQPCLLAQSPGTTEQLGADPHSNSQPAYVPMSQEQRRHDYFRKLVSPISLVSSAASAGIGQWRDQPEPWGQGGQGYARRFGSSFGQHLVRETLIFGISSGFHEDNRFVPSDEPTARGRFKDAVAGTFLATKDDGSRSVSVSKIGGLVGAAFLSRLWQPPGYRTAHGAEVSIAVGIGVAVGFNVAREFVPRIFRRR